MLVLTATRHTQGDADGDYSFAVEGELVIDLGIECARPDQCGCGRGFAGLASAKATTTALVVDIPEFNRSAVIDAIRASLIRQGWLSESDADSRLVASDYADDMLASAAHFGEGAVVRRSGEQQFTTATAA